MCSDANLISGINRSINSDRMQTILITPNLTTKWPIQVIAMANGPTSTSTKNLVTNHSCFTNLITINCSSLCIKFYAS